MYYTATLIPHADGKYDVGFVDLPGCISQGDNLDDALRSAAEGLSLHVGTMIEDGDDIPTPSTPEQCRKIALIEAEQDNEPLPEGTLWQYVHFEPLVEKKKTSPVRLSISLKPSVIEQIDSVAEEMGLTRSGVIAVATRDYAMRVIRGM